MLCLLSCTCTVAVSDGVREPAHQPRVSGARNWSFLWKGVLQNTCEGDLHSNGTKETLKIVFVCSSEDGQGSIPYIRIKRWQKTMQHPIK